MSGSDAMREDADPLSGDHASAKAGDMHSAISTSWDPHDVWLTRIKQPRDRAAGRVAAAALRRTGMPQD